MLLNLGYIYIYTHTLVSLGEFSWLCYYKSLYGHRKASRKLPSKGVSYVELSQLGPCGKLIPIQFCNHGIFSWSFSHTFLLAKCANLRDHVLVLSC